MSEVAAQLPPAGAGSVGGAREPMGWTPWGFWATAGLGLAVLAAWQGLQMLVAVPFVVGVGGGVPAGAEALAGNPEYLVAATFAVKHGHGIEWWKAVIATAVGWFWGLFILPLWFVFFPLAGTQ